MQLQTFIRAHINDDIPELLLKAGTYKDIDVRLAAVQILARRKIKDKLPSWYANDEISFPSELASEQCSSEQTARYKQRLVGAGDCVIDMTGGLGVDAYYFSQKAASVVYIEKNEDYCRAAEYNFAALGAVNISVLCEDSVGVITSGAAATATSTATPAALAFALGECTDGLSIVLYFDPSRRGSGNKRLYSMSDCEPDIVNFINGFKSGIYYLDEALIQARIIAKLSPMLDINAVLQQVPNITEIHILSVRNECKELIINIKPETSNLKPPTIYCINMTTDGAEQSFIFTLQEELEAQPVTAQDLKRFLYEPNASIMKAGAFKTVAVRFGLWKLSVNSHLYTSDMLHRDFPGRVFEIKEVAKFNRNGCKQVLKHGKQANVTVRNFPMSAQLLSTRLGLSDGGETYIFATTLANKQKVMIIAAKIT
ncbi:MAG: SAM-dependent methyltransferase [Tannerella sp.]|jgi:hypothetical protein|nr:SAM-dependent methyltransferase [Tannerella sp.]